MFEDVKWFMSVLMLCGNGAAGVKCEEADGIEYYGYGGASLLLI